MLLVTAKNHMIKFRPFVYRESRTISYLHFDRLMQTRDFCFFIWGLINSDSSRVFLGQWCTALREISPRSSLLS